MMLCNLHRSALAVGMVWMSKGYHSVLECCKVSTTCQVTLRENRGRWGKVFTSDVEGAPERRTRASAPRLGSRARHKSDGLFWLLFDLARSYSGRQRRIPWQPGANMRKAKRAGRQTVCYYFNLWYVLVEGKRGRRSQLRHVRTRRALCYLPDTIIRRS
ncbi:hypothetical protein FKP32DRAFT_769454 [Trametes sanguinea]|nr:hypothetical protein FKP32DRAFT_769454 [Trametes sanguinea]